MLPENVPIVPDPIVQVPKPDEEFTEAAPWQAQAAGDNKTDSKFFKYRTIDEVLNSHKEISEKAGSVPENAVYLPGEDASDEEKTAFNKALGVPDAVDAYKKIDTGLDPSVDFTEQELSGLAEVALQKQFKPEQFEAIQEWYAGAVKERLAEVAETTKATTAKMTESYKEKWGEDYKVNVDAIAKATEYFGGAEFKGYLNSSGLGNFPKVVDFLVEKGLSLQDPALLEGGRGGKPKENPGYMEYPSMKDLK